VEKIMIALYSYPELFGVADNNGYGLKVFAFLKLTGVPITHKHIFDASAAPRGQLPYIVDDGEAIVGNTLAVSYLSKGRTAILMMNISPDGSLSGKWSRRTDRGHKGTETWKKV
jgi:hypothetical protein